MRTSNYFESLKRIGEEFKTLNRKPICDLGLTVGFPEEDNYFKWRATLCGPYDTSYAKGIFYLEINFSEDYPNRTPEIHFITPIYHPNVNIHKSGSCSPPLGSIYYTTVNCWNPSTSIIKALTDLYAIFYWANPDCCFSPKMGEEYKFNRPLYEKKVKYFTKKYAIPFGKKNYDKDWDFSCNENDLIKLKSSKIIPVKEISKDYNDNELIQLIFLVKGENELIIQCKLKDLTRNVIKRVMERYGMRKERGILFISNSKRLKTNIPIGENGLRNHSKIIVIYGFKCS